MMFGKMDKEVITIKHIFMEVLMVQILMYLKLVMQIITHKLEFMVINQ